MADIAKSLSELLRMGMCEHALKIDSEEFKREALTFDENGKLPMDYLLENILTHNLNFNPILNFNMVLDIFGLLFNHMENYEIDLFKQKNERGESLLSKAIMTSENKLILPLISHSDLTSEITLNINRGNENLELKINILGLALYKRLDVSIVNILLRDELLNINNLDLAVKNNYVGVVDEILTKRPEFLHEKIDGTPFLEKAISRDYIDMVYLLLDKFKFNPDAADTYGYSPLCLVLLRNEDRLKKYIEILLRFGADPNCKSGYKTPLEIAYFYKYKKVVLTFLEYHPDIQLDLTSWSENEAQEFLKEVAESEVPDVKAAL